MGIRSTNIGFMASARPVDEGGAKSVVKLEKSSWNWWTTSKSEE